MQRRKIIDNPNYILELLLLAWINFDPRMDK